MAAVGRLGKEVACDTDVTRGDTAEVFQPTEHALDRVLLPIEIRREAGPPPAVHLWRDVRCSPLACDLVADGVAVIGLVLVQNVSRDESIREVKKTFGLS